MKITVLGSGLMGPAAAFNAMSDPDVSQVVLCDLDRAQLDAARARLAGLDGGEKLATQTVDLTDRRAAVQALAGSEAAIAALPREISGAAILAAVEAGAPLIDLTRPPEEELAALMPEIAARRGVVILGCGVEPGLTEIVARHLARQLDRADELHIKCGGIPARPTPPLGYKIVFGGRHLPLRDYDGYAVEGGRLAPVPRYSGVEPVVFPGVGECEAWHETFMPWLLELPEFANLRRGTQKTIRWPGYAAKVAVLKEMGLLSLEPVEVDGVRVAPKRLLDALLYPHVRLEPERGDRDLTLFRVEVLGQKNGRPAQLWAEMVDRYDEALGFTSMARTTAFTGAIVARMVARGDAPVEGGRLVTPEQIITGPRFDRLLAELAAAGIHFTFS